MTQQGYAHAHEHGQGRSASTIALSLQPSPPTRFQSLPARNGTAQRNLATTLKVCESFRLRGCGAARATSHPRTALVITRFALASSTPSTYIHTYSIENPGPGNGSNGAARSKQAPLLDRHRHGHNPVLEAQPGQAGLRAPPLLCPPSYKGI